MRQRKPHPYRVTQTQSPREESQVVISISAFQLRKFSHTVSHTVTLKGRGGGKTVCFADGHCGVSSMQERDRKSVLSVEASGV